MSHSEVGDNGSGSTGFASAIASRIEQFLLLFRPHLIKAQALMLVAFLLILLAPLLLSDVTITDGPFGSLGALTGLLLWGVWLPLLLISAVFAGRAWCGLLCPMGATTEWMSRIGLQRPIPGWLKWSGVPLASFLVISLLNEATGADDNPIALAILFGSLFFVAITIGFLYGRDKRAWCRHACPIGMTLGISSRLSGITFEPKQPRVDGEQYTEKTSCPTMINLKRKTESRHCLACAKCVAPNARGGLRIALRRLGTEIRAVARNEPKLVEVLFIFSAMGIAAAVLLEDVPGFEAWLHRLGLGEDFLSTLVFFSVMTILAVTVLSALITAAANLLSIFSRETSWRTWFFRIGYGLAPLALASLLFCMCGVAFEGLEAFGVSTEAILAIKSLILLGALTWCASLIRGSSMPPSGEGVTLQSATGE